MRLIDADELKTAFPVCDNSKPVLIASVRATINHMPTIESEIVRCKDCVKHNKGYGYYHDGTVIGIKDCCPLVEIRGMAQGHEFDYQYCAYAERRTDDGSD